MPIVKKRVVNVRPYLAELPLGAKFRFVTDVDSVGPERLKKVGFSAHPDEGDTLLPAAVGPVSRFNSEGCWKVHRDRPKELRYVNTVFWRWTQWTRGGGREECEDFRDVYRLCYPRDFVDPPAVELTLASQGPVKKIVSPLLTNNPDTDESSKHVLNLFLELFGVCDIDLDGVVAKPAVALKKVNWKFLPPGEYPWDRLEQAIGSVMGRASDGIRRVIWDRQETIKGFNPTEIYSGEGGFRDYVAYVFAEPGIVILESIRKGNALYVFGLNWQDVARLSKAEVLSNNFHLERIVHTKGWKRRLGELFY